MVYRYPKHYDSTVISCNIELPYIACFRYVKGPKLLGPLSVMIVAESSNFFLLRHFNVIGIVCKSGYCCPVMQTIGGLSNAS